MELTNLQLIGGSIRLIRKRKRLTQEELAVKSGLQRQAIIKIESGKSNFEINTLFLICKELKCRVEVKVFPIKK